MISWGLQAKNLAVTTSSLATTLKMMNSKISRLFFVNTLVEDSGLHFVNFDLNTSEVCDAFPKAVGYKVMQLKPRPASPDEYFLRFPADALVESRCPQA